MIERGSARECEVVLAFLQAEVQSSRFEKDVLGVLENNGLSRAELIDDADLENPRHNAIRRAILGAYRGYGDDSALFRRFPTDVAWRSVEIELRDHVRLKFANEPHWVNASEATRSVKFLGEKIAHNEAPADPTEYVLGIQRALRGGAKLAPLIIVEGDEGALIIVEGHCRATAYVGLDWNHPIPALLGSSPQMRSWYYY
jgi:hypothetical protein